MAPAKRRGNNEGSVYRDAARDRWIAQVVVDGRKRRAVAATEAKAKRKLREMLAQLDSGRLIVDGHLTVRELLELWWEKSIPNRDLEPRTIETYERAKTILIEDLGGKYVRTLTPDHVEAAFAKRATTGLSRSSLVKVRSALGQALAWAERRGLALRNVARISEIPSNARRPVPRKSMTAVEAQRFLAALNGSRYEAMWTTMLYLGLRPGEAAALSWDDIDFNAAVVHVRRAQKRLRGRVEIGTTKTPGSVRSLDAPPRVMIALRARQKAQIEERLAAGARWMNLEDLVFTNSVGSSVDPPKVRADFDRVIATAELGTGWSPNSLRHSAASLMSDAGVPLERIADQLGHRDTRMLSMHYRHHVRPTISAASVMTAVLEAG